MTAPAFTCRCIQQAEDGGHHPPFCNIPGNHFNEFYLSYCEDNLVPDRFAYVIEDHYHAHALGAPHSHMGPLGQPVIGENCSCHDWNQMADPEHISEHEMRIRGSRWMTLPESMIDGAE
ncbi:hypothetical protein LCGC14_2850350 [marine sediment metagenome]|uniref:Uncharacterized protein n=1 Tax=marine sediment metagenome TaxID=412755 RepID=A0A0F8YVB7_9ZZZZ